MQTRLPFQNELFSNLTGPGSEIFKKTEPVMKIENGQAEFSTFTGKSGRYSLWLCGFLDYGTTAFY